MPEYQHETLKADDPGCDGLVDFGHARDACDPCVVAAASKARDRLCSCCFTRGPLLPVILTDGKEAVHVPRRLLEDSVLIANSPRRNTASGVLVVRLKDADPAHLDGLRLMMDALKRRSLQLESERQSP